MKKKIVFFTGARSEFDLMHGLYSKLKKTKEFNIRLVVSGSHSSKKFGSTYKEIKANEIKIDNFVKIINKFNTKRDILKSISDVILKNYKYFYDQKPNLVFLIGDRYETFSISVI